MSEPTGVERAAAAYAAAVPTEAAVLRAELARSRLLIRKTAEAGLAAMQAGSLPNGDLAAARLAYWLGALHVEAGRDGELPLNDAQGGTGC